jgi:hypothetical protein
MLRRLVRSPLTPVVLAFVTLSLWALSSPIGSSPDDNYHLPSIWCAPGMPTDECTTSAPDRRTVPALVAVGQECYAFMNEVPASCQDPILASPEARLDVSRFNAGEGSYPPVFYAAHRLLVSSHTEFSIYAMRIANVIVFLGLLSAIGALSPLRVRRAVILTLAVTSVPLGVFIVASNNPSSWAITGVVGFWAAGASFMMTQRGRRRIALAVLAAASALIAGGARADAGFYILIAAVAMALLTFGNDPRATLLRPGALARAALILVLAMGSVVLGRLAAQTAVIQSGMGTNPDAPRRASLVETALQVPDILLGAFGIDWGLGWLDTPLPAFIGMAVVIAVGGVLFIGLRYSSLGGMLALGLVTAALVAIPTWVLYRGNSIVGEQVQPRYLLPLLLVAVLVATTRLRPSPAISLRRPQVIALVTTLAAAQLIALAVNIKRYAVGMPPPVDFAAMPAGLWWVLPVPPIAVLLVASAAWTTALALWFLEMETRVTEDPELD